MARSLLLTRLEMRKGVNRAATILMVLAVEAWPACNGVRAQTVPQLPAPLQQLLEKGGGLLPDAAGRWLGNWQSSHLVPVRNDHLAALMERSRREDAVVPLTDALFAPETAAVGQWNSTFYLDNYGTAIVLAAPLTDDRIPVLLVPGIGGSPRDFAEMIPRLQRAGYQPIYFVYPTGMALGSAAQQLGERLQEFLGRHDFDRLVLIGHSMGGLVAKGLLDEIDVAHALPSWRLFIAISSPFGGIPTAQYAGQLPKHPPAWDDLNPNSAFMHNIQSTRYPRGLHFYLFFGARNRGRLMAAMGNNDGVLSLESMCGSPVTALASGVFGFYEDHTSILVAPLVFRQLEDVLATELER